MELNYTKQPTIVEVQLYVNMLSEKLETMHVDLNQGFRRQTRREENDAHIITLNDENLGNRINALIETTDRISKRTDAIEKIVVMCLKNAEILNKNFKKVHQRFPTPYRTLLE